jgi:3,4-dihydroxy 2-butanone 4-phosphate synthase
MNLSIEAPSIQIQTALAAMRQGIPIILQDDDDRENEADLIVAASCLTITSMAQMIRDGSGIVCLCLTEAHAQRLALPLMVEHNQSRYGTAFTHSIEARHGVTTGVSAADRVTTIRAATAPGAQPQDLARPGHVFPLIARPRGLLERRGHTEGAVDLARLAGLPPAAVLCELMNPDGSMMRGSALEDYAAQHQLPRLSIDALARYCATLEA